MSELTTPVRIDIPGVGSIESADLYLKSEVDKVIDELKAKLRVLTSNAEDAWKLKDSYHSSYAEAVKELYEKNKEIAQLQAMLEERNKQIGELDAIAKRNQRAAQRLRKKMNHHKYKRCLDMAKWCYSMDCRMLNEASDNGTYFKESWCWKRASWYGKWKRKWLELAEKFKEGV